jgi:hypothetical protein
MVKFRPVQAQSHVNSLCLSPFPSEEGRLRQLPNPPPFLTLILNFHPTPLPLPALRFNSKGYGSRESEGYANLETESGSASVFLFNDEEREAIRRAEKSRCDKNRFAKKGADANLPPFPYLSSRREVYWVGSERGLCRSSARRSIARSSGTLSTLPHLASSRS